MKTLLHIVATPRGEHSRTLKIANAFLKEIARKDSYSVETLNLFETQLPQFDGQKIMGKYELMDGQNLSPLSKESWSEIVRLIEHFLSFDAYVFSVPMWNFSIPYVLKHYIDLIFQPGYLFTYTEEGPKGLAEGKKALFITSRGGDYSQADTKAFDQQEPYFKTAFPFIGITDLTFIHAQGMDTGDTELKDQNLKKTEKKAIQTAQTF